jgi:hypothetical protein
MPAIITDNLKIKNCSNFVSEIAGSVNNENDSNYYIFIGLSNPDKYFSDWNSNPQSPIDNTTYLNFYRDNILGVKKIKESDVVRVVPKIEWKRGTTYDLYRHDYSVNNTTKITGFSSLYDSNFYVVNDFKVYLCLNNGASESNNMKGLPSTIAPVQTDTADLTDKGDGYVWKYLYTISPGDFLKYDSTNFISVPNNWETSSDASIVSVRESAVDGEIKTILIERAVPYNITSNTVTCGIEGDGSGGTASVTFDSFGNPTKVQVLSGGSGYTFATLNLDSVVSPQDTTNPNNKAVFNVIIPPEGGHGADIYKELGANRALVYARIENSTTNPDFITENQFASVGIIKDVKNFANTSLFSDDTGSALYGIALSTQEDFSADVTNDSSISQTNSNGSARGTLVSSKQIDSVTILKYSQTRNNYADYYSEGNVERIFDPFIVDPNFSGLVKSPSYEVVDFDGNNPVSIGDEVTTYNVSDISGNLIGTTSLGQEFTNGISTPDINTKSGDILYVDNRVSVTRSPDQREDIKIIIEF